MHADGWTDAGRPGAVLIDNRAPEPLTQRIALAAGDSRRRFPVDVFVDDGERVASVRIESAQPVVVDLAPVAPFTARLFLVWADSFWVPGGGDRRQLGVQVSVPASP